MRARGRGSSSAAGLDDLVEQRKPSRAPELGRRRRRPHTPGLKPEQMNNPRSYVTHRDFSAWSKGLLQAHAGELGQWRRVDELSKTSLAIAAVLSIFSGLRRGDAGAAVQMDAKRWGKLLGCSDRAVRAAFRQLEDRGWVKRRRRLIAHEWEETYNSRRRHKPAVITRKRADVHGRAYLLPLGQVRVLRRGQRQGALVQNLRKTHAGVIRTVARRISDAVKSFLPSLAGERRNGRTERERRPLAGAAVPGPATGPPSRASAAAPHQGSTGGIEGGGRAVELERLWSECALTPALAWPAMWFGGDDGCRRWLRREFETHYRAELVRRFVLGASSADVAALQRRLEADAERVLEVFELQPTQRQVAIAKYNAKVEAFRRNVEQLGRQLERRR